MKEKIKQFIIENFKHDITKIENEILYIKNHPVEIIDKDWSVFVYFLQEEIWFLKFQKFHKIDQVKLFHFIYEKTFLLSIYEEFIKWDSCIFFRKSETYTRSKGQSKIWFGNQEVCFSYDFLYRDFDRDYKPYGITMWFETDGMREFEITSQTGLDHALKLVTEKIEKFWFSQRLKNLLVDKTYTFQEWCKTAFWLPLDSIKLRNITENEVKRLFYQYYSENHPNFSFLTGITTRKEIEGIKTRYYSSQCKLVISKS